MKSIPAKLVNPNVTAKDVLWQMEAARKYRAEAGPKTQRWVEDYIEGRCGPL